LETNVPVTARARLSHTATARHNLFQFKFFWQYPSSSQIPTSPSTAAIALLIGGRLPAFAEFALSERNNLGLIFLIVKTFWQEKIKKDDYQDDGKCED